MSSAGPTLNLNFLADPVLDSKITFTRSSTGSFIGSNGLVQTAAINSPRFEYDPITLKLKGLLIEGARTNLLLYSEQMEQSGWTKTNGAVTANTTTSPSGATDADMFAENTVSGAHSLVSQAITTTAGTVYTISAHVKAAGRDRLEVRFNNTGLWGGTNPTITVNLTTGTILTSSATVINSSITQLPNNWYRVSVTGLCTTGGATSLNIVLLTSSGTTSYLGDGTSGVLVWGAQIEASEAATSYITTTSATVTRAADTATISGTNFSNWYNQTQGTFIASFDTNTLFATSSLGYGVLSATDGTSGDNQVTLYPTSNYVGGQVRTGNVTQADINSGVTPANNSVIKLGLSYATNDIIVSSNGASAVVDTSATIPQVNQLYVGRKPNGVPFNGHLRSITYYPTRSSSQQLQGLTKT